MCTDFCGYTAKVWCLILREPPLLMPCIHPRVFRWLRKVRINVSGLIFRTGGGIDCCRASTIEHLKTTLEDGEAVVFFYCDFRDERTTGPAKMMCSLLSQLLRHCRHRGVDPGDLPDKILKQKNEGALSLNDLDKLCDLVSSAASCFDYQPIIVIDALDECSDIKALLEALLELNLGDVRLLVTSRPDREIMDRFGGRQCLSFENVAREMAADIELHVRHELNQLKCAGRELRDEIHAKLNERAEGR